MRYVHADIDTETMRCVTASLDDGVLTITLNRPHEDNAIDAAMSIEMVALLRAVAADETVHVVVLRGADGNFSCGLDARDFLAGDGRDTPALRTAREAADEWRTHGLRRLPQPVIALVQGCCRGGALSAVAHCDIVLTADDAAFGAIGTREADLPLPATAKAVAEVMTRRAARRFFLTGGCIDGREAEGNGLATRSLAPAALEAEAYALAREVAAKDAIALRFTKQTLQHVGSMTWDAALDFTAAKFAELKTLQAGRPSTRAAAVESFLAGKSKPGLGR